MSQQHPTPIFNPNADAHAMQSLNAVMVMFQTAHQPIAPEQLADLEHSLTRLVDCLFPIEGNSADFAGITSLPSGHYVHPIKTAEAAVLLGRATGMPRSKLITLAWAAALMNVGYLALKQSLLDEPRRLMDGEWEEQVHTHPSLSVAALTASGLPHEAIVAIGQHHERWDGSGYPHGVRGEEISIEARILAIADTFISLRSERPYRAGVAAEEALRVIADDAGTLYEPPLVDAFADVIRTYAEQAERKAGGVASSCATDEAVAAQRSKQAQRSQEEFAAVRRDPARSDSGAADDPVAGVSGRSGRFQPAPPRVVSPAYVAAARPATAAEAAATAPRAVRRRAARAAARPVAARRRPSLFSADVYLRGMAGRWLS
jgi:hypothetical protein